MELARNFHEDEEAAPHGYVVAVTTSRIRRLHYVGSCGRIPGIHYHRFEVWGDTVPDESEYHKRCITCFRPEQAVREVPPEVASFEMAHIVATFLLDIFRPRRRSGLPALTNLMQRLSISDEPTVPV